MKIRFFINATKASARAAQKPLVAAARRVGLSVTTGAADVIISVGGDGTILRAVHEFPGVPILGLNLGGLGYLASVAENDFASALARLAAHAFTVQPRTMLEVVKRTGRAKERALALNEVMVRHEMSGRAVALDVAADGHAVTRYLADGLVVATPTGSTAYSLSAGGPILVPGAEVLVVTPLCPHALGARPVVTPDTVRFSVTSRRRSDGRSESVGVYADGEKAFSLAPDETADIVRASSTAQFISLEGSSPYETLAHKLGWSGC